MTRRILTILGLPIVALLGLMVISIFRPIPIPFASAWLARALEKAQIHETVQYDRTLVSWSPGTNSIEVQLENVRVLDPRGDPLANVPGVQFGIDIGSLAKGEKPGKYFRLVGAKVNIVKTAGGALKVDIGETDDGSAGAFVERILVDMAAVPSNSTARRTGPSFSISDGILNLENEITNSRFLFESVDLVMWPSESGVVGEIDLVTKALGETMVLHLDVGYATADQSFHLQASFDNVRPAVLSELLPNLDVLYPFELPMSGLVTVDLDKYLTVQGGSFEMIGAAGSLEIAEFSGRSLNIDALSMRGLFDRSKGVFSVSHFDVRFVAGQITGAVKFQRQNNVVDVDSRMAVQGISVGNLMPLWFTGVDQFSDIQPGAPDQPETISSLSFSGLFNLDNRYVSGLGTIELFSVIPQLPNVFDFAEMNKIPVNLVRFSVKGVIEKLVIMQH